jgi:hypothetical protein
LTSTQAVESILNGKTVKDDDYGYYYRLPTSEEIEHFCEGNDVIRTRKCDTTTIKLTELQHYEQFMGRKTMFGEVQN